MLNSEINLSNLSLVRIPNNRLFSETTEETINSLTCQICEEIIFDPIECSKCQNIFCKECLEFWLKKKEICPLNCPGIFQPKQVHKLVKKSLLNLKYKCENFEFGCKETPTYVNLIEHEKCCIFSKQKCPLSGCLSVILKIELNEHLKVCLYKEITCENCSGNYSIINKDSHDCVKFLANKLNTLKIELKSQVNFSKKFFENHEIIVKDLLKFIEKPKVPRNVCFEGHDVTWVLEWPKNCGNCTRNFEISRFFCETCNKSFCINCLPPIFFENEKCPINHSFIKVKDSKQRICDLCKKSLFNIEAINDSACDFDVCYQCYDKHKCY